VLVDLNADLGESYGAWRMGDDEALLGVVTSANVACGFHAGDPTTIRRVVRLAAARHVVVGAHVSYPDLRGFGRMPMALPPAQVRDDVLYQLGALGAFAKAEGTRLRYVKAHGALYHASARDEAVAEALVAAVSAVDRGLVVMVEPGSRTIAAAQAAGIRTVAEGFADRAYQPDGRLVPRDQAGAVLADPEQVALQARSLAVERGVVATDGSWVALQVESICVHGDSPGALRLAKAVRTALEAAGVAIAAFVGAAGGDTGLESEGAKS
jgi:UPF0271 protein